MKIDSLNMSKTATDTMYAFHLVDEGQWETYIKHRPGYPDSMFRRWLDHHGRNNKLEAVHDLGTGGGVGTIAFLKSLPRILGEVPIKTFHLSDPGEANISAARRNLTSVQFPGVNSVQFPGVNFTFHQGPAEEMNPNIAPGTLDMVMACECLHWTSIEPTMRNVAASLRPGGTFATILYLPVPRVRGNPAAVEAQHALERLWRRELDARGVVSPPRSRLQMANGLDYVPMDPEVWEPGSVVRWYCNVRNREWVNEELMAGISEEDVAAYRPPLKADFGREREEVVMEDLDDWGRRGVGAQELRNYMDARMPGVFDDILESDEWSDLVTAIERQGGRCDVEIPAVMIMARKK